MAKSAKTRAREGSVAPSLDPNNPSYVAAGAAGLDIRNIQTDYMKSLEDQVAQKSALPGNIQTAFEAGRSGLQAQAAQSLAASKAARGGRGIAAGRGSAIASGREIATLGADAELEKGTALQEVAEAKTALYGEKKKAAEAQILYSAQVSTAVAETMQIIDDESGVFVTTKADIEKMKTRFNSEIAKKYGGNPEAMAAAIQAFNNAMNNEATTELISNTYS